ncbi:MAG: glycosyltransferase family 2 protein [Mycoplasmataceae bacterium]|nr:glycosyltransferase family 2 protein [Mycoplasmataceae bacterium]
MKLTIIYHVYKNYSTLVESLTSLTKQDDLDFELLLINDGATNKVKNIISKFNFKQIKHFSYYEFNQNLGHATSYNTCLENLNEGYVYYCGSNIILTNDFVSTIKKNLINNPKTNVLLFGQTKLIKDEVSIFHTISGPLNYCVPNSTRSFVISIPYLKNKNITYNTSTYFYLVFIYECLANTTDILYINRKLASFKKSNYYTYNLYDVFEQNNYLIKTYGKTSFFTSHKAFIEALMIASVLKNFLMRIFQTYNIWSVRGSACEAAASWLNTNIPNWRKNKYFSSANYFLSPLSKAFADASIKPFALRLLFKKHGL